ncbi:MAG: hypothetical protein ACOYOA_16305, partial [Saprospiraceae bacterium]
MIKNINLFLLYLLLPFLAKAQDTQISKILSWKKISIPSTGEGQQDLKTETFEGAEFNAKTKGLPWFGTTIPVAGYGKLNVQLKNVRYEPLVLDP